jgi:hypothetical protein
MAGLYRLRWSALVDESTGQSLASRQAVDFGTELPILKGKQGVPGSAVSPW